MTETMHLTIDANVKADTEGRRIVGVAVPWDVAARTSTGQTVTFKRGSVDLTDMPVLLHHDSHRPIGLVVSTEDTDDGLVASTRVSRVPDGDAALVLADDGALRGFSVGVTPTEWEETEDGWIVAASDADHLALVVSPAFKQAKLTEIAAAAAPTPPQEEPMTDTAVKTESPAVVSAAPRLPINASKPNLGEWMQAVTERESRPELFEAMQARIQAATGNVEYDDHTSAYSATPFVGDLIDLASPGVRPVSEAFGILQGPAGVKSFVRPKISGHLANAATAAESADVTDDGFDLDSGTVTMSFIKRAANVSAEAQAFSSPDVYQLVGRDLVRAYLRGFEAKVVTDLQGGSYTAAQVAVDGSDAVEVLSTAAAGIAGAVQEMPDLFLMAPDVWAKFVGFTATDGRALFPSLSPANASGANTGGLNSMGLSVLGLNVVVAPTLTAGKAYLANKSVFEVYESSRINMGPVSQPTTLGTAWAIGGAVGTFAVAATGIREVSVAAA